MNASALSLYRDEVLKELKDDILEFWLKYVVDFDSGGFHGSVNGQGVPNPAADKGVILATRLLWTFSRAYGKLRDDRYLKAAKLMNRYVTDHFVDKEFGGVYWTLNHQDQAVDAAKKFYGQAFSIYAYAEYSRVSGDQAALQQAIDLFALVEKHGRDPVHGGYIDAVGRDWKPVKDTRLSEKDLNTPKSMNTNLHVLEAYSTLALLAPSEPVKEALESLTRVFLNKILLPNKHFGLFFEMNWKEVSGAISYGHDIEGSWLMLEAAKISGNEALIKEVEPVSLAMATAVLNEGVDTDGGVLNEREADGKVHPGKEWWVQAEAMVGFFNAYETSKNTVFLERSRQAWELCKKKFLRPGGEWYSTLNANGEPDLQRVVAGPWKCPYHNSRACLEIMERIECHA